MTVEEIEIIVTARVTEVLKEFIKILPAIKQTIKQVQDAFDTIDTTEIEKNMKKIISSYSKTMKKISKENKIKLEVTNNDANKAIKETEKVTRSSVIDEQVRHLLDIEHEKNIGKETIDRINTIE